MNKENCALKLVDEIIWGCVCVCVCVFQNFQKICTFLGAFAKLLKATFSFAMSVCLSAWNNSAATGRIFMKFDI